MKKKLLFIIFLLLPLFICGQIRNYSQELINMLSSGKCFEAKKFYEENQEFLLDDFTQLFYQSITNMCLNKPDSACISLAQIMNKYPSMFDGIGQYSMLELLKQNLVTLGDYHKALEISNSQMDIVTRLNDDTEQAKAHKNYLMETLSFFQKTSNFFLLYPQMEINSKQGEEPITIKLQKKPYPIFNAQYNNQICSTLFDTGSEFSLFLSKEIADKVCVKEFEQDAYYPVNNKPVKSSYGILDSMVIGNISLKNVPVFVVNDKSLSDPIFQEFDIVLGLPLIQHLGVIEIDVENNNMCVHKKTSVMSTLNCRIKLF